MFEKILIANRGEVALRVIGTCRRLGICTVVIHSASDANAFHVREADEAVCLPSRRAAEAYLDPRAIAAAAGAAGAQAVHPGYGFLAEDPRFAEAVEAAGLVFIGPTAETIEQMGDKVRARALAEAAGVPVTDGTPALSSLAEVTTAASSLGFPLMMKLAGGGGGIGVSIVREPGDLKRSFDTARLRGERFFGDDRVYLERYVQSGRHVEVQVFGDGKGAVVHLFDRDCSIQRRHQKVVEEAPAPGLTDELGGRLRRSAVDLARSMNYRGAGTVEFMVTDDAYYFLEMNTRLQVEHPVTELVTVEWQLYVASRCTLPVSQQELVTMRGSSVEVRLYAEDPWSGLPTAGALESITWPRSTPGRRVDAGYESGDEITTEFDPLVAKLMAWGETRPEAVETLSDMLEETAVSGTRTNLPMLSEVLRDEAFQRAEVRHQFPFREVLERADTP